MFSAGWETEIIEIRKNDGKIYTVGEIGEIYRTVKLLIWLNKVHIKGLKIWHGQSHIISSTFL